MIPQRVNGGLVCTLILGFALFAPGLAAAAAGDFIWIEGEAPKSNTMRRHQLPKAIGRYGLLRERPKQRWFATWARIGVHACGTLFLQSSVA